MLKIQSYQTLNFKGTDAAENTKQNIQKTTSKISDIAQASSEGMVEISNSVGTLSNGMENLIAKGSGPAALITAGVSWFLGLFKTPVLDENGNYIKFKDLTWRGQEIEKYKTKVNWKRVGTAGIIVAAVATIPPLIIAIRKKHKQREEEKKDQLQHNIRIREMEQARQIDEIKHQRDIREISQAKEMESAIS